MEVRALRQGVLLNHRKQPRSYLKQRAHLAGCCVTARQRPSNMAPYCYLQCCCPAADWTSSFLSLTFHSVRAKKRMKEEEEEEMERLRARRRTFQSGEGDIGADISAADELTTLPD